jgi:hypothetical protein
VGDRHQQARLADRAAAGGARPRRARRHGHQRRHPALRQAAPHAAAARRARAGCAGAPLRLCRRQRARHRAGRAAGMYTIAAAWGYIPPTTIRRPGRRTGCCTRPQALAAARRTNSARCWGWRERDRLERLDPAAAAARRRCWPASSSRCWSCSGATRCASSSPSPRAGWRRARPTRSATPRWRWPSSGWPRVRHLARRSLQDNSRNFLELARQNLGCTRPGAGRAEAAGTGRRALVAPIREALQRTERQIAEIEKERNEAFGSIRALLESISVSQQTLSAETRNLVTALRRPEVRGQWGEMTLRRLVELAGMVEHCDFTEQQHTASAGRRAAPGHDRAPGRGPAAGGRREDAARRLPGGGRGADDDARATRRCSAMRARCASASASSRRSPTGRSSSAARSS